MEHLQTPVGAGLQSLYHYRPHDGEAERVSNCYLMSVVAVIGGMPLPIINLLATLIFFLGNRRSTYFVRWHCTQALLSQLTIFIFNSAAFSWTIAIITGNARFSNKYVAYLILIILFNLLEFIINIITAIRTRKGIHVEWWFWGTLANNIVKERKEVVYG